MLTNKMGRSLIFMISTCSALLVSQANEAAEQTMEKQTQPNIVLLFADDAGYADFGFQGSQQMRTPNLDLLAESGVRLTQFYDTASVCGPSRAGMLTGMYQQRFGFEENNVPGIMSASGAMGEDMGLPLDLPTMGDHLQELGYRTAIFGKWHLGEADRFHPTKRGFDDFYGFRGGARSFFPYPEGTIQSQNRGRLIERGFLDFNEHEGYLTDVLAVEACDFIERNQDKPLFAYVSFNAVHMPLQAAHEDRDEFPELEGKRRTLAQMTLALDRACGRILDKLKELELDENTLVVFTNDNGGPSDKNASSNYPFAGVKATYLEGGIRVPGIVSWPGRLPAGGTYEHPISTLDLLPTFIKAGGGDPSTIEGLDGVDLLPFLQGEKADLPHQTLYWKHENRGTIRNGDWKMMRFPDRPAELYNLADDPAEQSNLAATNPELMRSLYKELFAWELELERPLFQLRREEEAWAAERFDQFRQPPPE
jgi:arylsulfatase A-like enzyme